MLVPASRNISGTRSVRPRHLAVSTCAACQRRNIRFGPWVSSQSESELHREARKRHHAYRYQYMESLNRNLSWHNRSGHDDAKHVMKKAMAYFMQSPSGNKYVHPEKDIKSWSDDISGLRPGRNIEDVERDAMNHLLRPGGQHGKIEFELWKTPLRNIRKSLQADRIPKQVTPEDVIHATTSSEPVDQGLIDPITNRRKSQKTTDKDHATQNSARKTQTASDQLVEDGTTASFTPKFEDVDHHPNLQSTTSSTKAALSSKLRDETNDASEQARKEKELLQYKSSRWAEPHSLRESNNAGEVSEAYDDLPSYSGARWAGSAGVRTLTPEERSKEYEDLEKYGPVTWNEPDGLQKPTPEELSKSYSDLGEYKPVMWNEPDGLRPPTKEEEARQYDDLSSYDGPRTARQKTIDEYEAIQRDPTPKGNTLPPKVEVAAEDPGREYKDLGEYGPVYWNEPDGLPGLTPEERSRQYNDLHLYRAPFPDKTEATPLSTTPDVITESELAKYQYRPNPLEKTEQVHPEELTKQYKDLDKYRPREFDPIHYQTASVQSSVGSGVGARGTATSSSSGNSEDNGGDNIESMTPDQVRANVLRRARASSQTLKHKEAQASTQKLTGNYMRDFPEEFSTSWSTTNSPSRSTLYPKDKVDNSVSTEPVMQEDVETGSMDESFPAESYKLEPALNRHARRKSPRSNDAEKAQASTDPYSKVPQGLETSYAEETGEASTWPTFVKHYDQSLAAGGEEIAAPVGQPEQDHALQYKILAYDSTTDSIRLAETSSAVHDASPGLTPADIIPQMNSPAKFFPYFDTLQAEGYEIVSGRGDALVFRKVRSGRAASSSSATYTDSECELPLRTPPVNPVDLMGRPVTGNFASPTGFVNYESLAEERTDKPAPPFRASAGARPDASGASGPQDAELQKRKKRSLGRKMALGTAYVAGGAYAVGVMGEYFASGAGSQSRGQGPRRF